ncbi:MAG: hypothetical protein EXR10_01550 [Alphaproteobacteria bacterium]|nr:hypothetical protein [Alphaproteobacteria bacterium]PHY01558.1 MAG: hypothetical protein CK529_01560 [Rhodospirillaceae bacterium]
MLGYHTGCIVAVDLAIRRPDPARKPCLVAVPYYDTPKHQQKLLAGIDRFSYGEEADHVVAMWNNTVKERAKGVSLEQAVDISSNA